MSDGDVRSAVCLLSPPANNYFRAPKYDITLKWKHNKSWDRSFNPNSTKWNQNLLFWHGFWYCCVKVPGETKKWRGELTLYLLTWKIWWVRNNTSKGRMRFNSPFNRLDPEFFFLVLAHLYVKCE